MRSFLRCVSRLALFVATVAYLSAQVSYTGGTYTQNFDSLPASGTVTLANPTSAPGLIYSLTDIGGSAMNGWSFIRHFPATASGTSRFLVSDGGSNTAAVFSYGTGTATERALGALGSGSNASRFGLVLTNNTGVTISSFTLSYTGEQWRRGTATTDRLVFSYAVGLGAIAVPASTQGSTGIPAGFAGDSALDYVSPMSGTANAATNGNTIKQLLSKTVTGITWAPGQTLVLQWTDRDDAANDDGLAIDDVNFSTSVGPAVVAPVVTSTTPPAGTTGVPVTSSIVINFNVPTTVSGAWYDISGSVSGNHTATVLTNTPSSYTLMPQFYFAEGETVSVKLDRNQITDTATGTAHPAADHTFTFTTQITSPLPIHTIQGSGATSPFVGQVQTIQGIVTASFQGTGSLGGFYVQAAEADYDANPDTSEGIFVFNNSFTVAPGDVVKVTGTVAEFGTTGVTQTEFTSVTGVTKLASGATLPAPVEINLPFASLDFAERYEGMRATLPQTLTVTDNFDLGHFGELFLSVGRLQQPTNVVAPGAPANAMEVSNFLSQVMLDDAVGTTYPNPTPFLADSNGRGLTRRAGSKVTGIAGIFDQKFGSYILEPTAPVTFVDANPRLDPPAVAGTLKVAIGNVLNFFNGNGAGGGFPTSRGADTLVEYQRQRVKIIAGITALAPDIMGLTEVENDRITNGLPDSYGPTSAIADLVNGLNAAAPAGTTYAFVNAAAVDIVSDQIHCAFIYRIETVEPVGNPAMLDHPSFTGTLFDSNGRRIGIARNPLAQTFRQLSNGEKLTVTINHFKSKGSASSDPAVDGATANADKGDGQGESNQARKLQAQALVNWLATDPTGSGDPDFLIIGDLNAYAKEDPIAILEAGGYINLTEASEGVGGYSYAFGGQFGHLDHALANDHLSTQVADAATWHVNSDEPVYYDYNVENKTPAHQAINAGGPYRYSDHDPVVVGLNLQPDAAPPSFTTSPDSVTINEGESATFTVAVAGYPAPTLQWFKGLTLIPGATGTSYTVTGATIADGGSYSVVAANSQGTATAAAVLTVNDITPPIISPLADQTLEATGPTGAIASFTATALDAADGSVPVSFDLASGTTFALGTTTVTATAVDAAGNTASATFTITVVDTTAPTLTLPANQVLEALDASGAPATFAASASDLVSGSLLVNLDVASGSTFPIGTTTVTATATDTAGNTGSGTFTITVRDTTAPTLSPLADQVLEAASASGATATFAASANDAVSGSVLVNFDAASGSTFPLGTTTVTATATDAAGNTGSHTFTVTVQDTTAPTLSLPADQVLEAAGASGAPATFTASASDLVSGSVPVTFNVPSGSTFSLGTTLVTATATDASGNTRSGTFTIKVQDTTAPTLTLPANQVLEATGSSGAPATFTASASDLVSGGVPVTFSVASGSTFPLGTTTVTATATDAAGNTRSGTFTVKVQDTTAPLITALTATPGNLGSPNHKMIPVTLTATISEAASAPVVTKIVSVTSNEALNATGDGNTAVDWQITGNLTLNLRSERSGNGNGRAYTITVESRDAAGNVSTRTVNVTVSK